MELLNCLCLYSFYVAKNIEQKPLKLFSCKNLEELFMSDEKITYSEILKNEGFKNIAGAIGKSTRKLQYLKRQGKKPNYAFFE